MVLCEILLVLLSFGICIYSAATDLKRGIISNKVLLFLAIPCAIINLVYYSVFCRDIALEFVINFFALSVLAILFYVIHIWGGGDSKMLMVLAFAMPARLYYYAGNELIPLLAVVIFTFSFGYLFLIAHSLVCILRKTEIYNFPSNKSSVIKFLKDYLFGTIYLTFLISIIKRVLPEFYIENQVLFLFVNVFVIMLVFEAEVFRNKWLLTVCAVSDIVLFISERAIMTLEQLWVYPLVALLFLVRQIVSRYNYKQISISELHPGMIISAVNVAMMLSSDIPDLPTGVSEDMSCRLTTEQVEAVKSWFNKNKSYLSIIIVRKIPFAIFISMGYCVFLILGLIK